MYCIFILKYYISTLNYFQAKIEDTLIEKLNVSNICEFANAALTFNAKKLEEHCICFLVDATKTSEEIVNVNDLPDNIKLQALERMLNSSSNHVI